MSSPSSAAGTCSVCGEPRLPGAKYCGRCGSTTFETAKARAPKRLPSREPGRRTDLIYIGIAAVLAVIISHMPLIDAVIYPFKLFGTFVHEWSHALVAEATGGSVTVLQINGNLSGETFTRGGWMLPIFSAGYIGVAVTGAVLLLIPTRYANRLLVAIGALSILMPVVGGLTFGTSFTPNTWLWTAIFGGVTLIIGLRAPARVAGLFQQFVAIELCLTAIDSLRDLAWISVNSHSTPTDALNAEHYYALPALVWTIIWAVVAVAAIAFAGFRVVRRSIA